MTEPVTFLDGRAMLFLGDCREVMAAFPPCFSVDAVVTDPPYGVNFSGKKTRDNVTAEAGYASYDDAPDNINLVVLPIIAACRQLASRVVLTPGIRNLSAYPKADHVGAIYYPAGAGMNSWGFTCWQPILYYGKDPYGGSGSRPDSFESCEAAEKNGHPCPKPIGQMTKMVARASLPNETILDPFMGTGTTGVAAVKLGRRFIGIEIEPKYFDIACERIEAATKQPDMFIAPAPPAKQDAFL